MKQSHEQNYHPNFPDRPEWLKAKICSREPQQQERFDNERDPDNTCGSWITS